MNTLGLVTWIVAWILRCSHPAWNPTGDVDWASGVHEERCVRCRRTRWVASEYARRPGS